ncbi:MAG: alpha/beta fold hydrolase [Labilithrix sp.]|nr:alpha/beta fold hydrolase [Labilithrix sp.]MCW5818229.1 alpha/beta fold hydrolase [Labilithrix sp.]
MYGSGFQPPAGYDEIEVRASDGVVLRANAFEPPDGVEPRASVVLAHAMFARRSSLRGLARALAADGWRAVTFDFRGHGDSTPSRTYRYDDLVAVDLPAVVECVRARAEHPVVVLGHSLGAHVAVAAQGTGRTSADAIVMLGGNVWLRALEPSAARWAAKRALARATLEVADRAGVFPARALRLGTDDASAPYLHDLLRGVTSGTWASARGDDYLAAAVDVKVPVAAVVGARDRIMCHPACGERFARRCGGPVSVFTAPCGHMALRHEHALARAALAWVLQARG